jgi:beta-glucosidase
VKDFSFIQEGDLKTISTPLDFLGINFYNRDYVCYSANEELLFGYPSSDLKRTAMDWEITPWALKDTVVRLRKEYTNIPVYITENGSAWNDELVDGSVHDYDRIDYLKRHLEVVSELNEMDMNVLGYYAWSLMDNYEWALGYTRRFGIVYVDYETQIRYPKDSFYYYQQIIKDHK